jgi:hypothetical protein
MPVRRRDWSDNFGGLCSIFGKVRTETCRSCRQEIVRLRTALLVLPSGRKLTRFLLPVRPKALTRGWAEYTYRWNSSGIKNMAEGYKRCPEMIGAALAHFSKALAEYFEKYVRNTRPIQHTMFFSQLGSPETTVLHKSETRAPEPADVRSYWERRKK